MCSPKSLPISNTIAYFKITIVKTFKIRGDSSCSRKRTLGTCYKSSFPTIYSNIGVTLVKSYFQNTIKYEKSCIQLALVLPSSCECMSSHKSKGYPVQNGLDHDNQNDLEFIT